MGIYIKGMEMPEICDMCPLLAFIEEGEDHDAFCYCRLSNWKKSCTPDPMTIREARRFRRLDCPLVEVPKHGRLIDADALKKRVQKLQEWLWDKLTDADVGIVTADDLRYRIAEESEEFIDDAPAIIESEGK